MRRGEGKNRDPLTTASLVISLVTKILRLIDFLTS
jgi:hypothetical protein